MQQLEPLTFQPHLLEYVQSSKQNLLIFKQESVTFLSIALATN